MPLPAGDPPGSGPWRARRQPDPTTHGGCRGGFHPEISPKNECQVVERGTPKEAPNGAPNGIRLVR
jgi:hypothetical protein